MNQDCFYHLTHLPVLPKKYLYELKSVEFRAPDPYIGHTEAPRPRSIVGLSSFKETKFCQDLQAEFGQVHSEILKFNPMSGYGFHKDIGRNFAINFVLTPVDS